MCIPHLARTMRTPILLVAILALAGCDRLQSLLDESTGPADGWTSSSTQSPVHGSEYRAQFSKTLNAEHQISEGIDITCIEREKALSVKFYLYGDKESDPDLSTGAISLFGFPVHVLTGSASVAGSSNPIKAMEIVSIGDFKNELVLHSEIVNDLPQKLPIALEITSNQGMVTYQIPKSDAVMSVVNHCVADQDTPAASSSNDTAPSTPQMPTNQDSTASPAIQDVAAASTLTDTNLPATPATVAPEAPTPAVADGSQPAPTPPQGSAPADPVVASLHSRYVRWWYSPARTTLLHQGYALGSPDAAAAYGDSVANDAARCDKQSCSIPWSGNGESFCVRVSMDDDPNEPRWRVDAITPCE